jgi:RNA polymerase sigma-70 factor (ECF subfamily)
MPLYSMAPFRRLSVSAIVCLTSPTASSQSAAEADDIVQDVWLRWQTTDRSVILDAPAFLATMTTRLAINLVQSARSRHETHIGTWLPEPVDTRHDPHLGAERGEALEFAILLLLEKLSPTERASYVLHEAFDYSYQGIAAVLKLTEANIRQLVSRARKHISDGRRATVSAAEQRRLLVAFMDAAQKGDTAALEELFAADVSTIRMAVGSCGRRRCRFPVVSASRSSSRRLLRTSGLV